MVPETSLFSWLIHIGDFSNHGSVVAAPATE